MAPAGLPGKNQGIRRDSQGETEMEASSWHS